MGTKSSAWTRDEVWLVPAADSVVAESTPAGILAEAREFALGANTRRDPPPVRLDFPCGSEVAEVTLVGAGDWSLVAPVKATAVSRAADTCTAQFAGWSVLRHIRVSDPPPALHLHARGADGEIRVDIPAQMKIE